MYWWNMILIKMYVLVEYDMNIDVFVEFDTNKDVFVKFDTNKDVFVEFDINKDVFVEFDTNKGCIYIRVVQPIISNYQKLNYTLEIVLFTI